MTAIKLEVLQTALENKAITYDKMMDTIKRARMQKPDDVELQTQETQLLARMSATKELLSELGQHASTTGENPFSKFS